MGSSKIGKDKGRTTLLVAGFMQVLVVLFETVLFICIAINEAYSWGVGEYDSEDGVDGGSEGCVGAAVVGVKDAPGFQLRDTSFYEVADSVDFLVELLFTVV